jgi:hypothetical protein
VAHRVGEGHAALGDVLPQGNRACRRAGRERPESNRVHAKNVGEDVVDLESSRVDRNGRGNPSYVPHALYQASRQRLLSDQEDISLQQMGQAALPLARWVLRRIRDDRSHGRRS